MEINREQFRLICTFNYETLSSLKLHLMLKDWWYNQDNGCVGFLYRKRESRCRNEILVERNVDRELSDIMSYIDSRKKLYERVLDEISFSVLNEIDVKCEVDSIDWIDINGFEKNMRMKLIRLCLKENEKWENWIAFRHTTESDEARYLGIDYPINYRQLEDICDEYDGVFEDCFNEPKMFLQLQLDDDEFESKPIQNQVD